MCLLGHACPAATKCCFCLVLICELKPSQLKSRLQKHPHFNIQTRVLIQYIYSGAFFHTYCIHTHNHPHTGTHTITLVTRRIFHSNRSAWERAVLKNDAWRCLSTHCGSCMPIFCYTMICKSSIKYHGRLGISVWLLLKLHIWRWQIRVCHVPHRGLDFSRTFVASLRFFFRLGVNRFKPTTSCVI